MRIHKKIGSKERLFEMFENVNKIKIKENQVTEIGLDHPIVQGIINHLKENPITNSEELELGNGWSMFYNLEATDWRDVPYSPATRIQPEEGGYPEDVKGALLDVIIYDEEDDEFILSDQAYEAINNIVRFDGDAYEDLEQKAANGGEDEYSRADFARDDSMNESSDVNQEIDDEFDMRYSNATKTIPHSEINDVAEMYGVDFEIVAQIAADVIARNLNMDSEEITNNMKDLIKRMHDNNVDPKQYSPNSVWEVFENEYEMGTEYNEFRSYWDKLVNNSNQLKMFESAPDNPSLEGIKYKYDENGNYIPVGYEDKNIGLRHLEQPIGSGNWNVAVVQLGENGEVEKVWKEIEGRDQAAWKKAREALHASIT